jgi:hypothetical protein
MSGSGDPLWLDNERHDFLLFGLPVSEGLLSVANGRKEGVRTVAAPDFKVFTVSLGHVEQAVLVIEGRRVFAKDFSVEETPRHSKPLPSSYSEQLRVFPDAAPLINLRCETELPVSINGLDWATNDNPANDNDVPQRDAA